MEAIPYDFFTVENMEDDTVMTPIEEFREAFVLDSD